MSDYYVTDLRHFLDDEEGLPVDMHPRALSLVLHLGAIVEWMTALQPTEDELTNVCCRRRPGRKRCPGQIMASFDPESGAIEWGCLYCSDGGLIFGWQDSYWDRTPRAGVRPNQSEEG